MDQGWRRFPLLVALLTLMPLRNVVGFEGGVHSNTHLGWGQASADALSHRAVQSSLSEAPVTAVEAGAGLFTDGSQRSRSKFANLHQFVKGGVSSSYDATSRTQTVPSGIISSSVPKLQDELHVGSLTPLQPQSSSSSTLLTISPLTSGQRMQNQFTSSSQGSSGQQLSGGSRQFISHKGDGGSGGLSSSPAVFSQNTPDSNSKFSSSPLMVPSQATTVKTSPGQSISSSVGSSGPSLEASGSASRLGDVDFSELFLQSPQHAFSQYAPGASTRLVSSASGISSQSAGEKSTFSFPTSSSVSSSPPKSIDISSPVVSLQDSCRQPSLAQSSSHDVSGRYSGSQYQSFSSQISPGSLTSSKLTSLPLTVSSLPTSDQSLYVSSVASRGNAQLTASCHYDPVQRESSPYAPMLLPQDVSSQTGSKVLYRPTVQVSASPQTGSSSSKPISLQTVSSKPINVAVPQGISGTTVGDFSLASQDMGSSFRGPVESQGTFSQLTPGSPSYFKLSSSHLVASPSTNEQSLYSQLPTSLLQTETGTSDQRMSSQGGSGAYSGTFSQSQPSSSKLISGYSKLISPQVISSQPTSVASRVNAPLMAYSHYDPMQRESSSRDLSSLMSQGTSAQYAAVSPLRFVNFPMHLPQDVSSRTGSKALYRPTVQVGASPPTGSSFSRPMSTQTVSSKAINVAVPQGSSASTLGDSSCLASQGMGSSFSGSMQSLGASSQLAPGQSSLKLSSSRQLISTQGGSGYYSVLPQSQGSLRQYAAASPSKYVPMSSPQSVSQQGAGAPTSNGGLTSTFSGGSGYQSGSPLAFQGSSAYVGPTSQGSVSQPGLVSPSKYASASLSSAQGVSSQYGQASQNMYSVSQSQRQQRLQPSTAGWTQAIQTSGAAAAQSQSSQMPNRLSSPLSAGGSDYQSSPQVPSGGFGQQVSTQDGSGRYGGMSLSTPSLYTPGSPEYAKLSSSPLGLSSQSTRDQGSSSLYSSSFQLGAGAQVAPSHYASLQTGSSATIGSSAQPQSVYSQYAPAPSSMDAKAPVFSQYSQASQGGSSLSLSQQSQKWQPSASSWSQGALASATSALRRVSGAQPSSAASFLFASSRPGGSVSRSDQLPTTLRTQSPLGGVQRLSKRV